MFISSTGDDSTDFYQPVDNTSQWGGMDNSMDLKSEQSQYDNHFPQNDLHRKRINTPYIQGEIEGLPAPKIVKPEDPDLVNLIKTIIDEKQNQELSKVDTFCNLLKSYLNSWPDRVQDEAINHITNYLVFKNIDINGRGAIPQTSIPTNGLHHSNAQPN